MDKINSCLSCMFHSIFGIVFGILIILVMGVYALRYPLCLPAAIIMSAAYLLAFNRFLQKQDTGKEKKLDIMIAVLFFCMLTLQLYLGYILRVTPSNDRNVIFHQAQEIADSGIWKISQEWNYYFLRYPNNRILLLAEAAYFSLIKLFGIKDYLIASIVLNIAAIDASILLTLRLARNIWNKKVAMFLMIGCFLFAPFYLFGPFVYTDTLTLPLVAGAANLYYDFLYGNQQIQQSRSQHIIRQTGYLCALAAALWFGYSLKASIAIILIAIMIHLVCIKRYIAIRYCLILLSVFILLQSGSNFTIKPATHGVMVCMIWSFISRTSRFKKILFNRSYSGMVNTFLC